MTQTLAAPPSIRIEQSPRWVRGYVKGQLIVDSKHVLVVYGERRLPLYSFPQSDVRMDLLQRSRVENGIQFWSLNLNGERVEDIAWTHDADGDQFDGLRANIAFEWRK